MKTLALGAAALAVLAASNAQSLAQAPAGFPQIVEMLGQLDANGDESVDRDEVPESGREAFDTLLKKGDANTNGRLEREEFRGLMQKMRALPAPGPAMAAERFKRMDADGDGSITRTEFQGPAPLFDRIDTDRDGKLMPKELRQFRESMTGATPKKAARPAKTEKPATTTPTDPKPETPPAAAAPGLNAGRLQALDTDNDGFVSRDEYRGPERLFDRVDRDQDSRLSRDEIERASRRLEAAKGKAATKGKKAEKKDETAETSRPQP